MRNDTSAMTGEPRTTVIIPVLNGERFILEAVHSVLAQLGEDDEVLVVDNGSTDGTRELLDRVDPRLKLLEATRPGPSAARNVGLRSARGELLAFLDHDDAWPAGRHFALRAMLLADASLDAVTGRVQVRVEPDGAISGYEALHGQFGPSLHWSCLFRRRVIDRVGLFDESLRFSEDLDYYIRLVEAGMKIGYCDHDSVVYRRHAGNATNSKPPQAQTALALVARKLARRRARSTQPTD